VSAPSSRADIPPETRSLRRYTQAIYLLHAMTLALGALSPLFNEPFFVAGLPSFAGIVMNHARRREVQDSWLAAHFRWQIRTFWIAFIACGAASLLFGPLVLLDIGGPLLLLAYVATGAWFAYRILRGFLALRAGLPPAPGYPSR